MLADDVELELVNRQKAQGEYVHRSFITLEWDGDRLIAIRDFYFARYVMESAQVDDVDVLPI